MRWDEAKIVENQLILSKRLEQIIKWKYPFYRIPKIEEYSQEIIEYSKKNERLPFFIKYDINNDGNEELIIVHRSIIGGFGKLLIISKQNEKFKFDRIKWKRPVNSLFFDYLIDVAKPRSYQTFGYIGQESNENMNDSMKSKKVEIRLPHIITKGYLTRIVFWDGEKYRQEKISTLNN